MYGKIREALGVRSCVVSGGGSLQPHLDEFYEVLDLTVLNGWGLSEVCCAASPSFHPPAVLAVAVAVAFALAGI